MYISICGPKHWIAKYYVVLIYSGYSSAVGGVKKRKHSYKIYIVFILQLIFIPVYYMVIKEKDRQV